MVRVEDLVRAWHELLARYSTAAGIDATGRELLACWMQPHRHYHDLAHLRGILAAIAELAALADDPDAVRLAAWYHDSVYEGRADDEEMSARMAEADLAALGVRDDLVAEVARLVRMTVDHNPGPGDHNGAVLSDADLSSLGLPSADYRRNTAAIRLEYAHVSDDDFRTGRTRIITSLLAAPQLFRTSVARERWEERARVNMRDELADLD